jgi:probable rRNA maturation factor
MENDSIFFFSEGIDFEVQEPARVAAWLTLLAEEKGRSIETLNYIFLSDEALHAMNVEHLGHDDYTDIISFPLHDGPDDPLLCDFFISVERVQDNASELGIPFKDELHRVMAHGLLHMLGYDDIEDEAEIEMRGAEDYALSLRGF